MRQRARNLIQRGELYFPHANQLNDPFEIAPRFRIPHQLGELLEGYERWAQRRGELPDVIEAKKRELTESFKSGSYFPEAEAALAKYPRLLRHDVPLCAFSATRESIPMWSYYADGHKGLCVHFDSVEPSPFAVAQAVSYQHEYPVVQIPIGQGGANFLTSSFLTKSIAWAHEMEYRLLHLPSDGVGGPTAKRILDDLFNWKGPQLACVKQLRHICGVTVGACMASDEIEGLLRACYERSPRIEYVEQSQPKTHSYELDFKRIA